MPATGETVWCAGCVSTSQGEEVCTGEASYGVMSGDLCGVHKLVSGILGRLLRSIWWFL